MPEKPFHVQSIYGMFSIITRAALTSQKFSHGICPFVSIFVGEHLTHASIFKSINSLSKILTTAFGFDILKWIEISVESEHNGSGNRETVQRLALAAQEGLQNRKV